VIAGVHYPTDIEAGRISAAVIDNAFLHDSHFKSDFDSARTEIRRVLKLDAAPPLLPASN
jgi:acid phosphatase (class A)